MSQSRHINPGNVRIASFITLAHDEVQLWRAEVDEIGREESRWQAVLSSDEIERAGRFHFAADRQRFTASRALLRMILAGYLSADAKELAFVYSEKEKPSLAAPFTESGIHFNLSHSGGVAIFGFARRRPLGVDIEDVGRKSDIEAIAKRFFSAAEQAQFFATPQHEKVQAFFRCWTRKEAYIKATGDGLSLPLNAFDVSLEPGSENALLATRPNPSEAGQWQLCEVPAGPGFVAALCVRGAACAIRGWDEGEESFPSVRVNGM